MNQATRLSAAVPPRLVKEIRTIRTSLLSDALGKGRRDGSRHAVPFGQLPHGRSGGDGARPHGRHPHGGNYSIALSKGNVLVIDGQGELNTALWGEVTTLAARLKGTARSGH
jgi:hypothetical protein